MVVMSGQKASIKKNFGVVVGSLGFRCFFKGLGVLGFRVFRV